MFCPAVFGTAAAKDDHILEHFPLENCIECNRHMIRIGGKLYVNHDEWTCVKIVPKIEDQVEACFTEFNSEFDSNDRKTVGSESDMMISPPTTDVLIKIEQQQNASDDNSVESMKQSQNHSPDPQANDANEQLDSPDNLSCSETDFNIQTEHTKDISIERDATEENNDDDLLHEIDEQRLHECEMCGMKLRSSLDLTKHKIILHSSSDVIFCDLCERLFTTISDRDAHKIECALKQQTQLPQKSSAYVRCDLCKKTFKTDAIYRQHMRRKHNQNVNTFKCDQCHATFSKECWLNEHQCVGALPEIVRHKSFECKICKKDFFYKQSLQRHQIRLHSSTTCAICKRHFANKKERNAHTAKCGKTEVNLGKSANTIKPTLLNENDTGDDWKHENFKCTKCSTAFENESLLEFHDCHSNKGAYFCSNCNKKFSGSGAFRLHQLRFHAPTELNGTVCKICGHLFATVDEREKHQLDCAIKRKISQQKQHGTMGIFLCMQKNCLEI